MPRFPGRNFLRNLLSGRTLLIQLVKRDFAKRFVGSAAGWIWGLIHPLVQFMVWTFVFQVCLKQEPPPGEVTNNYTVFLFAGYLPWMLFQETVMRSATTLVENSNLITKTVFPSEILPVTVFLSSMINHLLSLALAMVVIAVWVGGVSPMALLLPVYMLLLGMFAIGVGWIVASLQVYLRDTAQVLMVLMTLWFWITPIFISEELVPAELAIPRPAQSARLRRPRLPRASLVVSRPGVHGVDHSLGLRRRSLRHRRSLLPAFETWIRRRTLVV